MDVAAIFVMWPRSPPKKLLFPRSMEAPHEIWLWLAQWFWRRSLKMVDNDNWRMIEPAYTISSPTDQPKKKALFLRFADEHPLRKIIFFTEKNKNRLFRRGFSPQNFAEKLPEISRWVGKDLWFLHAYSEDSRLRNWVNAQPDMSLHTMGHKTNSESLCRQYNHRVCGHREGTMYR